MTYEIIHLKSELKSFSWNDGLFAIIEKKDGILNMCKIDNDGKPQTYEDGKLMITCTGEGNKGITKTALSLNWL